MLSIKFYPYEDEKVIFEKIAQAESEYEHSRNYQKVSLPKYQKPPKVKKGVIGWTIFALLALRP